MEPIPFKNFSQSSCFYEFFTDEQSFQKKVIVHLRHEGYLEKRVLDIELSSVLSKIPEKDQLSQRKSVKWLLKNQYKPLENQGKIIFQQKNSSPEAEINHDSFPEAYQLCKEGKWPSPDQLNGLKSAQGYSLLHEAIRKGDAELAIQLIERKIALYDIDSEGNTALHYAARVGDLHLVDLLWNQGLGIDTRNHLGQTALHFAALSGQHQCVETLLANGATPTIFASWKSGLITFDGLSPLSFAILGGTEKTLARFFTHYERHPDQGLVIKSSRWGNILHLAIRFYRYDLLKYLFEKQGKHTKALLEERDQQGCTPFILAAILGQEQALFFLKEHGANVEAIDSQGNRAMHHAALEKNIENIKYLYSLGASLTPLNDQGKTPSSMGNDQTVNNIILNLDKRKQIQEQSPPSFAIHPPENLVFQGGGPKGIAYVGVVEALETGDRLRALKRIAGTSAGAINACLMSMGYTAEETQTILSTTDLKTLLLDHPFTGKSLKEALATSFGGIGNTLNTLHSLFNSVVNPIGLVGETLKKLWHTPGICEGEEFRKFVEEKITAQTGIPFCTFKELRQMIDAGKHGKNQQPLKHLYVYAICVKSEQMITCINSEEMRWENMIISDAVRASMSIPGVFKPHLLHWKNESGERHPRSDLGSFIDGGVLYNFPLETFDKKRYQSTIPLSPDAGEYHQLNKRTLGFSLYTPNEPKPADLKIETVGDLLSGILSLYFSSEDQIRHLTPYNKHRVIRISNEGVGTLDFALSEEQKLMLVQAGRKGTENFFKQHVTSTSSLFLIPQFKDKKGTLSNVKPIHPDFIGRKELLNKMGAVLLNPNKKTLSQAVLCASGGFGKSETVIAFCHQNKAAFSLIHWIDASTEDLYFQAYKELAKTLQVPYQETEPLQDIRQRVHRKLQHQKNQKPFLLIFDNAEQTYPFPTEGNGALLVTSRNKFLWKGIPIFEVLPFTPEESQELLCTILKCTPSQDTNALAQRLDFYPLAINQAAHYIAETLGMTVEKYLQRLEKDPIVTIQHMPQDCRYPESLLASWKILEAKLQKIHPKALHFLQLCAYMHPDTIPQFFLTTWIKEQDQITNETECECLSEGILGVLVDHGLMRFNATTHTLSLHRFRQAMVRSSLPEERNIPQEVFSLLSSIANRLNYNPSTEDWEIFKLWAPHAHLLLNENPQKNEEEICIRNKLSSWEYFQGKYPLAKKLLEEALFLIHTLHKESCSGEADALNNLGVVHESLGNYEEAKKLHTKALNIRKDLFGERHADVATSLSCLGSVHHSLGNYEEAKKLYTQALNIQKELFGEHHAHVATSLGNLGSVHYSLGNYEEAKKLYTQALNIQKELFGEHHAHVATSLGNLGSVHYSLGNYEEAKKLYTQTLNIRKDLFGERHADVANSLGNLGNVHYSLGDYEEAKKLQTKALNILKELFGDKHPNTIQATNNLRRVEERSRKDKPLVRSFVNEGSAKISGIPDTPRSLYISLVAFAVAVAVAELLIPNYLNRK